MCTGGGGIWVACLVFGNGCGIMWRGLSSMMVKVKSVVMGQQYVWGWVDIYFVPVVVIIITITRARARAKARGVCLQLMMCVDRLWFERI